MTRAQILAELADQDRLIAAAYWAFTRQARAKPPVLAVPGAYAERARLRKLLEELDLDLRPYSTGDID